MNVLQRFVLPGMEFHAPDQMYVRAEGQGVVLRRHSPRVQFFKGAKFTFDTYFNGLTVDLWNQSCQVESLALFLKGRGQVLVRLERHKFDSGCLILDEREMELAPDVPATMPVESWPKLTGGMLFVSVFALEDGEIIDGGWVTDSEPCRDVRLALVVTHYNRQEYVLPAMRRLCAGLGDHLGKYIDIFVVDNSNNLDPSAQSGVTVLPNRNLGGAGGFARGLMEATDRGFTHCLFMDDDASCETESILRALRLLSYARRETLTIAGALLREQEPFRLYEKGARLDGLCRPLKGGLDMNRARDLLLAESQDEYPDYGGWWFFAFKISQVRHMPFPFFVHGDDIMFSMVNDFDIVTANGIACWCSDFGYKFGPMTVYLDVRMHMVQEMSHLGGGLISTSLPALRLFVNALFSYNYASAHAAIQAVRDVSGGSQFWIDNLEMDEVRSRIGALQPAEKLRPVDIAQYGVVKNPWKNDCYER